MSSDNWETYIFSDFVDINPSVKLTGSVLFSFVEMKDLNDGQRSVYPSTEREISGGARFQDGDTLFARITPCLENGKICQVRGLKNGIGFGSTEFLVFRGKPGLSDTNFIFYLARYSDVRRFAEQNMVGTSGRQRVSKEAFDNLELNLPSLPTQRRIAAVLTALDDKIELNRRMNETLEGIAQTLWGEWFGKYVHGEEELPEGWRWGKLKEMYSTTSGGTPSRSKPEFFENGTIEWVKSKELKEIFVTETEEKITELALESSSAKLLPAKSVLIAMYGATVGEVSILSKSATCNQAVCAILPNSNYPFFYAFQYLTNEKNNLKNLAVGAAQQNISQELIQNLELPIPALSDLTKYQNVVGPVFETILTNLQQSRILMALREALLPRLMNGELQI